MCTEYIIQTQTHASLHAQKHTVGTVDSALFLPACWPPCFVVWLWNMILFPSSQTVTLQPWSRGQGNVPSRIGLSSSFFIFLVFSQGACPPFSLFGTLCCDWGRAECVDWEVKGVSTRGAALVRAINGWWQRELRDRLPGLCSTLDKQHGWFE